MEGKKSNYLVAFIFATLLFSSTMAAGGHRRVLNKDGAGLMAATSESIMQLQEDSEVASVNERILGEVETIDGLWELQSGSGISKTSLHPHSEQ
ncbi:hypothetical protein ACP4OV_020532 [Aristida adscensionis]